MNDLSELLARHLELDLLVQQENKPFISDWNCDHPYYVDYFKELQISKEQTQKYNYIRADRALMNLIADFHLKNDGIKYDYKEVISSNGSATIISSFFVWLKMQQIKCAYYVPPIYYTFHFFSRIFNIPLRPISKGQLFEAGVKLNLPNKKSILILTDPIWYTGRFIDLTIVENIKHWQKRTGSLIFVDGSFQYFKWNLVKNESSATFDRNLTFRLICPSKIVATHGLRFAYLLLPSLAYQEFDRILDNLLGSSSAYDIEFAKKCMSLLLSEKSNNDLIQHCQGIYQKLVEREFISEHIKPDSGYFIFSKVTSINAGSYIAMGGEYFEQDHLKGYVRVNLLSEVIKKLF